MADFRFFQKYLRYVIISTQDTQSFVIVNFHWSQFWQFFWSFAFNFAIIFQILLAITIWNMDFCILLHVSAGNDSFAFNKNNYINCRIINDGVGKWYLNTSLPTRVGNYTYWIVIIHIRCDENRRPTSFPWIVLHAISVISILNYELNAVDVMGKGFNVAFKALKSLDVWYDLTFELVMQNINQVKSDCDKKLCNDN